MAQKPSIPKGTRDFSPAEMEKRNYIFNTIREAFHLFGYQQIETPAMENLSTLMGKYGDEGDKLLFKILNSGNFLDSLNKESLCSETPAGIAAQICEKGLRYDLTVPFARYVVQHRADIQMPFKRFQIQPVWRADRPQKGRYREFYQCDADVIGSDSLNNEIELLSLIDHVFEKFGINIALKINNRKVLSGIAEIIGESDKIVDITVAIDKIDKIGLENVNNELRAKGISEDAIETLRPILQLSGTNAERLDVMAEILKDSSIGLKGIEEIKTIVEGFETIGHKCILDIDFSLARGLNYYTGTIIEVKALDVEIGSITGGGRYDNLTGVFGMPGISGVGISFGADRIYDVLNTLNLYPEGISNGVKVMFINFGNQEAMQSLKCIKLLQKEGISAKLYPDCTKMKKQMALANAEGVEYVALIGEEELKADKITLKNMSSGEQSIVSAAEMLEMLR